MKAIMPEFILLFLLGAATAPTVTYAVEIKVSVPRVKVPHLAVPHANTPVITPHVNSGAGVHITAKSRVRHLSKGSIGEKGDKSSRADSKGLQDQLQQLKLETKQKQEERKLEGSMERQQDQLTQRISMETFSISNKIDPAAKASVVFVDQQNLKNDSATAVLGLSPQGAEHIAIGVQKGGGPGTALAETLATRIASPQPVVRLSSPSSGETRLLAGLQKNGGADMAELAVLVLMQAQNGASNDLHTIMQGVKAINSQKDTWRKIQQEINQMDAALAEATGAGYSTGIAGSLQVPTTVPVPHVAVPRVAVPGGPGSSASNGGAIFNKGSNASSGAVEASGQLSTVDINVIAGPGSNNSNGGGPGGNGSTGGGVFNSGTGGPSSNASNGGGIFDDGTGGPSHNAGETFSPPGGSVIGIYSAKDSTSTTKPSGEKVSGGYKIFKPKKYEGPNLHNKPNDVSIEHLELSNERILIVPH